MHRVESVYPQIAQLIQADLQAVGMKVSLQGFEQAAFGAKINAGEHQVAINDWTMDNSDPDNVMWGLFSTNRAACAWATRIRRSIN
jgi:ABC-type transport system substrate-binding protein